MHDITLDEVLLRFLALGELPDDAADYQRCQSVANYVQLEDNGCLLLKATDKEPARIVPPLKSRLKLLKNAHRYAGYPGADRLYQLVKT